MKQFLKVVAFLCFSYAPSFAQTQSDLHVFVDSLIRYETKFHPIATTSSKRDFQNIFKPLIFINGIERESDNLDILKLNCVLEVEVWKRNAAIQKFGDKAYQGAICITTIKTKRQFLKPLSVKYMK